MTIREKVHALVDTCFDNSADLMAFDDVQEVFIMSIKAFQLAVELDRIVDTGEEYVFQVMARLLTKYARKNDRTNLV